MLARGRSALVAFGLLVVFAPVAASRAQETRSTEPTADLARAVRAASAEEQRDAIWCVPPPESGESAGWRASQRELGMRTLLRASGIDVRPFSDVPWRWRASATSYGRDGALEPLPSAEPQARGNVFVYERTRVVEWYVNGEDGLEQGFTLLEAPPARGGAPLVLELALDTDLAGELCDGDTGAQFRDGCGEIVLSYLGLAAWDANGRALDARVRIDGRALSLVVDDAGASYPLVVDPVIKLSETELVPQGLGLSAKAGIRVLLSGTTAAVRSLNPKVIDIFERIGGVWTHQVQLQYLGDVDSWDLEGDWLIAAASFTSTAGRAKVYRRTGSTWQYFQDIDDPLKPYGCGFGWFGWDIDIDGERVAIGNADDPCNGGETIWVFRYAHGLAKWRGESFVAYRPPGVNGNRCGPLLALHGDEIVVRSRTTVLGVDDLVHLKFDATSGSFGTWIFQSVVASGLPSLHEIEWSRDDILVASSATANLVWVFERFSGQWRMVGQFSVGLSAFLQPFPSRVDVTGSSVVVGDPALDDFGVDAGGVRVFARNGGWSEIGRFAAANVAAGDHFGDAVEVDERAQSSTLQVAVGAPLANRAATDSGAAYVFELAQQDAQVYCTSKITSLDCIPRVAFSGTPSLSIASPFTISATSVINNANGIFFYGTSGRLATPFDDGVRCVAAPTRRAGALDAGGNSGGPDCSGVLALDFNARIQSGVDPNLFPGAMVDGQFYFRDAGAATGTGLSEAIEFLVRP